MQTSPVWSYGVTTVGQRRDTLLPPTLAALKAAGFEYPRLFVDGVTHTAAQKYVDLFGLPVTSRFPGVHVTKNWYMSMLELFARDPWATFYALFQDDFTCVRNMREYIESTGIPSRAYLNLYTYRENEQVIHGKKPGWYRASNLGPGHPPGFQTGKGALGLVFTNLGVRALLFSPHWGRKHTDPSEGWRSVDGAVVTAMNEAGWSEYVHAPSLLQHSGHESTVGKYDEKQRRLRMAHSYPGDHFDALKLLGKV